MMVLTKEQRIGLKEVFNRLEACDNPITDSYLKFRRTVVLSHIMGCVMVPFCGMWLGIEKDGYAHS